MGLRNNANPSWYCHRQLRLVEVGTLRFFGFFLSAGYVEVNKTFKGRIPNTTYQLTKKGGGVLTQYWEKLDNIRRTGRI